MKPTIAADIVIFGGGIAGLWLLTRLRQSGFSAILLESGTLGGGQTHKAQGIIHGGLKYALQGKMNSEAEALSDIPRYWQRCLNGEGDVDLSSVRVLSKHQYLFAPNQFTAKLTGFLAGMALSSKVDSLEKNHFPEVFQHAKFKGEVFSLNEMVIDVPSLVKTLCSINHNAIFKIDSIREQEFVFDTAGKLHSAAVNMANQSVNVMAQQFVFTAGAGNEMILSTFKSKHIAMQRRPLHMVLVNVPKEYALYAHCLGFGNRPRLTITTHHLENGDAVWYLGGQLAEEGIERSSKQQIAATRAELNQLFPWLNFFANECRTFMIDRAEFKQKNGLKPDDCFAQSIENMTIAWPTKLVLAPKLADRIMSNLQCSPQFSDLSKLHSWPKPKIASPIWEDLFCKNVV